MNLATFVSNDGDARPRAGVIARGRMLDVVPIAPAPEAPFGDYGDD